MSKYIYIVSCPPLHILHTFVSSTKDILVGNGQYAGVLFAIPVMVNPHGHRFEVYTLVS